MNYFSFPSKLRVTGYPTRRDLHMWSFEEAHQAFRLVPDIPTLLVFGGSKGARSINHALLDILPELLVDYQVIHISGHLDWSEVKEAKKGLPEEMESRYHPYPYLGCQPYWFHIHMPGDTKRSKLTTWSKEVQR
jgi:UDP-N-acetylglucosamine--N-acetylmuramyl-(pentapeptide) pyrophosphoryl-undecaprenol N-acetylglucosamine transferase